MSVSSLALSQSFFDRDVVAVARDLLGCVVEHGPVALRVVETEAYHQDETACHASRGQTVRTTPLFGPPGHAYVYLCYGIHQMFNVVTGPSGVASAVLIRGATAVRGLDLVRQRRRGRLDLIGPGKVGQALGVNTRMSGAPLMGPLWVYAGEANGSERVVAGPRVGIGYADPEHQALPWRFQLRPA